MKKGLKKFTKILVLIAMIFSDLMTPISVLADQISESTPNKGDVGINKEVTNNGEMATVSVGSTNEKGGVKVTKTVSKTDIEGRYKIDFKIEGKDDETSTEVTKPVYAVIVFDRSGSMESTEKEECVRWERDWRGRYCVESKIVSDNKWESAVNGAITFATTLSNKINGSKIALVGFSGDSDYIRNDWTGEYTNTLKSDAKKEDDADVIKINGKEWFNGSELTSDKFGSPNGGTNLQAGLRKANELLSSIADADAKKYVVVISDGQPTFYYDNKGYTKGEGNTTNKNTYDKTISEATSVKNLGAEIFSIGYMLPAKSKDDYKSAETILTEVSSPDKEGSTFTHYVNADPEKVANAFTNIAEEMSTASAGTNAVLTDNIGGKFTLTTDSTARSYVSEPIANITETGTTLSFYVDIDKDAPTDWYNTNEGFELKYTNAKGEEKTLTCDQNPQVYWVQNTYDYIVNYYKDSFNNKIASETRKAPNGTVINESNVERDKYLPEGYEFNTIDPTSITITNDGDVNDGDVKVIKILYTIKKFNYVVNYYYDEVLDNTITEKDIPYGTKVDSQDYYLKENEIREGYTLDTVKSDSSSYTITDNTVVINIYYKKNSYEYSVNYFFNNEKGFTNNSEAIYGDKITARSKWLTNDKLNTNGKKDYFLDPSRTEENNSEITIGTDSSKNVLDIYYINTNFDNITETISKTTNTNKVISSNDKVSYTINYNTQINNVRNGDTITVTITDTLPGAIIESESTLNGGVYTSNGEKSTITWTKTYSITEYQNVYTVSERINYTVKYQDYLSKNGSNLINTVYGNTTVSHENVEDKITSGKEDTATVPVEIKGKVTVYFKDEQGNDIAVKQELGEKLAGTHYETTAKEITGYTLKEEPTNKNGNYIEGNIDVIYYYTKNDGNITENELVKEGTEFVSNINDTFNYTLKYTGKVEEYVGKATLTITDTLPLKGTIVSKDNRCTFENNTITCTAEYPVNGTLEINEEFNFQVKYSDIKEDKIVNSATAKLALENKEEETTDETETEVYKGTVVATYKTDKGVKLHDDVETIDFAGTNYTTETKSFYGYTLTKVPTNKEGTYVANETIQVDYVYIKNEGTVTENKVNKVQNNTITDINSEYNYVLSYTGKVEDYVGEVTLELTDTLPYNAEIISKDNKCVVNGRTIVCTDVYTIDREHQVINATFNIVLRYTNVGSEVKNIVNSKLIYGNKNVTDKDEVIDVVPSGTVVATYKTDKGVKLHDDVETTDFAGTNYTTETKSFYGYTLREIPSNKEGTYIANETIQVDYVYIKNEGTVTENKVNKVQNNTITDINSEYNYVLSYTGKVEDYVGEVTLELTDTLPYNAEIISKDNKCVVNGRTIVCTDVYTVDKEHQVINVAFNIVLRYTNVGSEVKNIVNSKLIYGDKNVTDKDEVIDVVPSGTVVATYKTDKGVKLHDDVETIDFAGTNYTTETKSFYGYTLTKVPTNKEGTYVANETIQVDYVYTKNIGTSEEELNKDGIELVGSITDAFDYTITYNTEIKDYVGKATLTITDILPYRIDEEKSKISNNCKYNKENNTILCKYEMDNTPIIINIGNININNNGQIENINKNIIFNIEENFKLYYINVDKKEVTNKVTAELTYENVTKTTDDEHTTEVEDGTVIVNYVTKDGEKLTDSITLTGLVGTTYETVKKEFDKYSFIEVKGEAEGTYTKGQKEVTYVYDLTILPPQTGVEANMFMYVNYIFALIALAVAFRTYKTIKNN